eukprot:6860426-Alexandrium_andersonii.AAC.1
MPPGTCCRQDCSLRLLCWLTPPAPARRGEEAIQVRVRQSPACPPLPAGRPSGCCSPPLPGALALGAW